MRDSGKQSQGGLWLSNCANIELGGQIDFQTGGGDRDADFVCRDYRPRFLRVCLALFYILESMWNGQCLLLAFMMAMAMIDVSIDLIFDQIRKKR